MNKKYETSYYLKSRSASKKNFTPNRVLDLCNILKINKNEVKTKNEGAISRFYAKDISITTMPNFIEIRYDKSSFSHAICLPILNVIDNKDNVLLISHSIHMVFDNENVIETFNPLLSEQLQNNDNFFCKDMTLIGRINDDRVAEVKFSLIVDNIESKDVSAAVEFELLDSSFNDDNEFQILEEYLDTQDISDILKRFKGYSL